MSGSSAPELGRLARTARGFARRVVPTEVWRAIDEDIRHGAVERRSDNRARWTELWAAGQYLHAGLRIGFDTALATVRGFAAAGTGVWAGELSLALRNLARRPRQAAVIVATSAVCVGATTAAYSVVHGVLLTPLPFEDPDRLVRIWETRPDWATSDRASLRSIANRLMPHEPTVEAWREAELGLSSIGSYVDAGFVLQLEGRAVAVRGQEATSDLFRTLGVPPLIGRALSPDDDVAGTNPVVVLSEPLWRQAYAGSPTAVGEFLTVNGVPREVVGVMPDGFDGPTDSALQPELPGEGAPQLWIPLTDEARRGWKNVFVVGRLESTVDARAVDNRLAALTQGRVEQGLAMERLRQTRIEGLRTSVVADVQSTLWFLLAGVFLVLAVGAVNIAGFVSVSEATRRHELAIRAALGGSAGALARRRFTDAAVVTGIGAVIGAALAAAALPLLVSLLPADLPRRDAVSIDGWVLLVAAAVSLATAAAVSVIPAALAARTRPGAALRDAGRGASQSRSLRSLRSGLVVAEVALAVVLLVGAGLLGSSYLRLSGVDRGFDTSGLVVLRVAPSGRDVPGDAYWTFLGDLDATFDAIPGVAAVPVNSAPLTGLRAGSNALIEQAGQSPMATNVTLIVTRPSYHAVMGIPIVAGRPLDDRDDRSSAGVVVVNRALAELAWPGESPLGRTLRLDDDTTAALSVVGVAADVLHRGLGEPTEPKVYVPSAQSNRDTNEWVLRVEGDLAAAVTAAGDALRGVSPATPVSRVTVLDDAVRQSIAVPRLRAVIFLGMAGIAGLLALLGVHGVVSQSVAARGQEIAIRMAIGARASEVVGAVVRSGVRLALLGTVVGVTGALLGLRAIRGFLFQVSPADPLTYLTVATGVLLISGAACWGPARRVARISPSAALDGG